MKCSLAQELLHLNRPGERSPAEDAALRRHLQSCPACASEALRIERFSAVEPTLRRSDVTVPDLRVVRSRVMAETELADRGLVRWIGRLQLTFERPAARLAYGAIVLALAGWFTVGQVQVLGRRAELDVKMDRPASAGSGPEIVYSVDERTVEEAARAAEILPPASDRSTGMVEVGQSDLDELMRITEHEVLRAFVQGPQSRARLEEAIHVIRTAAFATIRFRTPGA